MGVQNCCPGRHWCLPEAGAAVVGCKAIHKLCLGNIALWFLLVFMVDRGSGSHVNLKVCSFERACLTQATFLGCMKMICFMERSRWP